jgi:hypothetical protein
MRSLAMREEELSEIKALKLFLETKKGVEN